MPERFTESFTERGVGKHLLPYLRRAKRRLYVCSPYLSKEYTTLLKKKAEEGVKVKLITSTPNKKALDVIKKKKDEEKRQEGEVSVRHLYIIFLACLTLPFLLLHGLLALVGVPENLSSPITVIASLAIGLPIFYRIAKRKAKKEESPAGLDYLLVPRSKYLVHTKMYIVDDEVSITGSANLTSSGMNKNLELIEIKKEETHVKEDVRDFRKIWAKGLRDVDV